MALRIRDQLKKQATSRQHPAWQIYLETLDLLRTFRPVQDSGYYASRVFRREENKSAKIRKGVVIIKWLRSVLKYNLNYSIHLFSRVEWQQLILFAWIWFRDPQGAKAASFKSIKEEGGIEALSCVLGLFIHTIDLLEEFYSEANATTAESDFYSAYHRPGHTWDPE